ncbi:MAG: hypothetical protein WA364_04915 [Candidatus Nitrosopolaris sp.]
MICITIILALHTIQVVVTSDLAYSPRTFPSLTGMSYVTADKALTKAHGGGGSDYEGENYHGSINLGFHNKNPNFRYCVIDLFFQSYP